MTKEIWTPIIAGVFLCVSVYLGKKVSSVDAKVAQVGNKVAAVETRVDEVDKSLATLRVTVNPAKILLELIETGQTLSAKDEERVMKFLYEAFSFLKATLPEAKKADRDELESFIETLRPLRNSPDFEKKSKDLLPQAAVILKLYGAENFGMKRG